MDGKLLIRCEAAVVGILYPVIFGRNNSTMTRSMTGYGTSAHTDTERSIQVEVRCLNSKFLDLNMRLPKSCSEVENDIRQLLSDRMERGKVSVSVDIVRTGQVEVRQVYNKDLFVAYYTELKKLADSVAVNSYDPLFTLALHSPDVIQPAGREGMPAEEKELLMRLLRQAVDECEQFRTMEGKVLESKFREYVASISAALAEVSVLDPLRVERVRNRLRAGIQDAFGPDGYDANRLEQEMIFHIEKLDIHEERVRLQSHLDYFLTVLKESQSGGKKLGFLAQEIGREINTIGSKANDAAIQVHVVRMKEELEKIKEQLNNVL